MTPSWHVGQGMRSLWAQRTQAGPLSPWVVPGHGRVETLSIIRWNGALLGVRLGRQSEAPQAVRVGSVYPCSTGAGADSSLGKSMLCVEPVVQLNKSCPLPHS